MTGSLPAGNPRCAPLPGDRAAAAADAYRELRRRQHAAKLAGAEQARVPPDDLAAVRAAVQTLWTDTMDVNA